LRNASSTKVVVDEVRCWHSPRCLVGDRAVMTFLMAVLTLKVAVLVNTSFANRKWLEMAIEAKVDHQQQRNLATARERLIQAELPLNV
jgi:hypothetical protein